jgi:DNA-binding transcriptional MerR regulator
LPLTPEPVPGFRLGFVRVPKNVRRNDRATRGKKANLSDPAEFRSQELARAAGVSSDTLRHYERRGLLAAPRRLANGYRVWGADALACVLVIQRALSVGFTLDELARFLRARARGAAPCQDVRALASGKLREIDERLRELRRFRRFLSRTLDEWDTRLAHAVDGEPARLLETLSDEPGRRGRSPVAALRFHHPPGNRKEKL